MMQPLAFRRARLAGIARDLASQQLASTSYQSGRDAMLVRTDCHPSCDGGAAFVAHCVHAAGLTALPGGGPAAPAAEATVAAWIAWATAADRAAFYPIGAAGFVPDVGDLLVVAARPEDGAHDHIGVIIDQTAHAYITAEGNVKHRTGMVVRRKDRQIQGCILLLERDEAAAATLAARVQHEHARVALRHGSGWSLRTHS